MTPKQIFKKYKNNVVFNAYLFKYLRESYLGDTLIDLKAVDRSFDFSESVEYSTKYEDITSNIFTTLQVPESGLKDMFLTLAKAIDLTPKNGRYVYFDYENQTVIQCKTLEDIMYSTISAFRVEEIIEWIYENLSDKGIIEYEWNL